MNEKFEKEKKDMQDEMTKQEQNYDEKVIVFYFVLLLFFIKVYYF